MIGVITPAKRFLLTCSRETLIRKWDTRGTESSEGAHSLGWTCQDEERCRKFGTIVGEYQWVVDLML